MKYFCDSIDRALDKALEQEPTYRRQPARPSRSRYYFMGAFTCADCQGQNECTCGEDK